MNRRVRVEHNGVVIADSGSALRILETAGAPTVYVPPADILEGSLQPAPGSSYCEWKGAASYFDVHAGGLVASRAAWVYRSPNDRYSDLEGHVSFYPALIDCRLDDELVEPQPGGFYGGWVTAEIVGPIKGDPGTGHW